MDGLLVMCGLAGPRGLDWATQPNPFRKYEGSEILQLRIEATEEALKTITYNQLYRPSEVNPLKVAPH